MGPSADGELGLPQSLGGRDVAREQAVVKPFHQHGGGLVFDLPEAGEDPLGAGDEKSLRQWCQLLSLDLPAEGGIAGAQHDEIRGESEPFQVRHSQIAVDGAALSVEAGEHQGRKLGRIGALQSMGGEVKNRVTREMATGHQLARRREVEGLKALFRGDERCERDRLVACEGEAGKEGLLLFACRVGTAVPGGGHALVAGV